MEGLGGVSGEGVGPQVAVVSGAVAVAREDVCELGRTVTHDQLGGHSQGGEGVALEGVGVDGRAAG